LRQPTQGSVEETLAEKSLQIGKPLVALAFEIVRLETELRIALVELSSACQVPPMAARTSAHWPSVTIGRY